MVRRARNAFIHATFAGDDPKNDSPEPASVIFDVTAAYVKANYEVRLNVTNVGDKTYYIGGYQNNPNRVIPGEPRTYAVTLRYSF